MGTQRPKIQGHILPELYAQYQAWKQSQGIKKDSQALNQILAVFLARVTRDDARETRLEALEGKYIA
jgi:hypothetical protein